MCDSIVSGARLAFVLALCTIGSCSVAQAQNEAATKIDLGGGQTLELIRIEPWQLPAGFAAG
jgi:hypothetical protein